jgi:hypothetical protein
MQRHATRFADARDLRLPCLGGARVTILGGLPKLAHASADRATDVRQVPNPEDQDHDSQNQDQLGGTNWRHAGSALLISATVSLNAEDDANMNPRSEFAQAVWPTGRTHARRCHRPGVVLLVLANAFSVAAEFTFGPGPALAPVAARGQAVGNSAPRRLAFDTSTAARWQGRTRERRHWPRVVTEAKHRAAAGSIGSGRPEEDEVRMRKRFGLNERARPTELAA